MTESDLDSIEIVAAWVVGQFVAYLAVTCLDEGFLAYSWGFLVGMGLVRTVMKRVRERNRILTTVRAKMLGTFT